MDDRPEAAARALTEAEQNWLCSMPSWQQLPGAVGGLQIIAKFNALVAALDQAEARANENEFDAKMALPECQEKLARVERTLRDVLSLAEGYSGTPYTQNGLRRIKNTVRADLRLKEE
jgi:hypothetical protein